VKTGGMVSFQVVILLGLFDTEDGGDTSTKRRLIFNGLHGLISQKVVTPHYGLK
jgi:hypothetical protein